MLRSKSKKVNKKKKIKLNITGWNTTDEDERQLRRFHAESEKFRVKNTESKDTLFDSFLVTSQEKKQYHIEIRSLIDHINSCNCPDYVNNQLGTCKHIEHVLLRLRKAGAKHFKRAQSVASPKTEIFLDHRDFTVRIQWAQKASPTLRRRIGSFFSIQGILLGESHLTYRTLEAVIKKCPNSLKRQIRVSGHIEHFIEYKGNAHRKALAEKAFRNAISKKKQPVDLVKHPLYDYQQEGMLHLAFTERALLADEMGLGKTVQAIAACELLRRHQKIKKVLVIATASLKSEWEEQIQKFTDLQSVIIKGSRPERLKQYQTSAFFYLTNYEQIIMDGQEIQRLLSPDVVILDEAQRIKNWQTKTASAVKELKSRYAFVLTGTPLENRIDDIYSLVHFLDPYLFGPLFRFKREFYTLEDNGRPIGYKNIDKLHQKLQPIMLRRRKEEVDGELPQRTVNNYFVKMEKEQRHRYDEFQDMVARLVAQSRHRVLRKEEFEKLQRWLACMRMICDSPFILDPNCRISPKISELESTLDELLSNKDTKILIFSEWARMLTLVRELVDSKGVGFAWHTGSVRQDRRRQEINRFKQDPHCRLFLSTDSGSVGLNLQNANVVINLDLPWNPAKLEQRIARAWRKHQTRHVQIINFICEDSIEHRMLGLLNQKQTLAQGVLEGLDGLKELKLFSGREAFMERMENLMGDAPLNHGVLPEKIKDNLDFLQAYQDEKSGQKTMLAVVEQLSGDVQKQLTQYINPPLKLEMLDRQTFDIIQRLEKAGILTCHHPLETLHASPEFTQGQQLKIQQKILSQAKFYLDQAEHKQRLAQVLFSGDFHSEALDPLREALGSTLTSFSWLIAKNQEKIILSEDFIHRELIEQHGLLKIAATLYAQLNRPLQGAGQRSPVEKWIADQKEIFQYVHGKLNTLTQ